MKKLFLLTVAGCVTFGASAQSQQNGIPFVKATKAIHKDASVERNIVRAAPVDGSTNKTTSATARWYSPYDEYNQVVYGNAFDGNDFVFPIFGDSTARQRFNTGLGTINYSSVAQLIDPIASDVFNSPDYAGEVQVMMGNSYRIDSVLIRAAYVQNQNRPTGVVDTLVFSVVSAEGIHYPIAKTNPDLGAKVPNYTDADTLRMFTLSTDSVNRAGLSQTPTNPRAIWRVQLTDADRDTAAIVSGNLSFTTKNFIFPVPNGGLAIPAGSRFAITATFKSGDTWAKNVDTYNHLHYFMPIAASKDRGGIMPNVLKDFNDRSMSQLMFATDTSSYIPSMLIEMFNTNDFDREFIPIAGYVTCTGCFTVGINGTNGATISEVKAYPNPANQEVRVRFNLYNSSNTTVSVLNTVGQVISTQNMGNVSNGIATFSTANLTSGVYFYTVEAGGQRITNRFVVAH